MKKNIYLELVFLFFLGALSSLSLPPFNFFLINFVTFSLLFYFIFKKIDVNKIHFFSYGWSFGFGYFLTNLYWISISLTFDENFKALIPFAIILVPAFLALFYATAFYFYALLKIKKIVSSFFLFALGIGLLEFIRGHIFTGFPWNLIAFSFSNQTEFINIISIIGSYGFNLICISLFMTPALFFLKTNRFNFVICILFLIIPISFYLYGYKNFQNFSKVEKVQNNFVIRAIGSNISLDRFYYNVDTLSIINELIKISEPDPEKKILFLWPEGIIPKISKSEFDSYKPIFQSHFDDQHLIGMGLNKQLFDKENIRFYNSFSIFDNDLNLISSYDKVNLVPFGEFLPFENFLKKIGFKTITNNYQSYSKGKERNIISIKDDKFYFKILPLICYEIIYSGNLFKENNFDYMINISEDGWFGKSIGPKQHFAHSIFRSIESGKYLIRSANNGKAALINPLGVIEKQVDFQENGYIDFEELRKIQPTIFSIYGNKIFGLIILLYIFLVFSFNRIKNE